MANKITLLEAVNQALDFEMAQDESVVVLGEDVGTNGGVFRATAGLKDKYGFKRVMDTPLAETTIAGISIGMASQGLKPIAEMQFMGFIYASLEQMISHAARMRNRTRGRLTCPMVLRAPYGGGIHAPEHHSESTEAIFAHIPGLRVVIPSSPKLAYGLLLAAMRNPDPVIFLEPKRIYRARKEIVENNGQALPLDTCFTLRRGRDITLVSWGAMLSETLQAANQLAREGIEAEVIDVGTVSPLDMETILQSVAKTGHCVIVQEAARTCSIGSEIASQLATKGFYYLQAPIGRVSGFDTIMPYYQNELNYMPSTAQVIREAKTTLGISA